MVNEMSKDCNVHKRGVKILRLQKRSGSLSVALLLVLSIVVMISATIYHVKISNAKQYELVENAYKIELMAEVTILQLKKELVSEQEPSKIKFPARIQFNTGTSSIQYDSKKQHFTIAVELQNGYQKDFVYQLDLQKVEVETKQYEVEKGEDNQDSAQETHSNEVEHDSSSQPLIP